VWNASGETMASFFANDELFEERPIGGRPFVEQDVRNFGDLVYLGRVVTGADLSDTLWAQIGASVVAGPNATGPDGRTYLYGGDLVVRWRPASASHGWPFVTWQTEALFRHYRADDAVIESEPDDLFLSGADLEDWGVYTQILYGFARPWAAGLRLEAAGGSGASVGEFAGRSADPFRDDRYRVSPLIVWQPTEFSRVRLQYNYDLVDHLEDRDVHSIWLGFEVLLGRHPPHDH